MKQIQPEQIDWSQAPEWANWYAKDSAEPAWPHLARSKWFELQPWCSASNPYSQWRVMEGEAADAPDFGADNEHGAVKRP